MQSSMLRFHQVSQLTSALKELLQSCRNYFTDLWTEVKHEASRLDLNEPALPHPCRVPWHLDGGS